MIRPVQVRIVSRIVSDTHSIATICRPVMKGYKKLVDMQVSIACDAASARIFVSGNFQAGKRARISKLLDEQHAVTSTWPLAFHSS
jgi:hypothetical protein